MGECSKLAFISSSKKISIFIVMVSDTKYICQLYFHTYIFIGRLKIYNVKMFSSFTYDYSFYILFFFLLIHEGPNSMWEFSWNLLRDTYLLEWARLREDPPAHGASQSDLKSKGAMGVRASMSKIMMSLQFSDEVMFVWVFLHMYLLEVYTWGFPNISKSNNWDTGKSYFEDISKQFSVEF